MKSQYPTLVVLFQLWYSACAISIGVTMAHDLLSRAVFRYHPSFTVAAVFLMTSHLLAIMQFAVWHFVMLTPANFPLEWFLVMVAMMSVAFVYSTLPTLRKLQARA